MKFPSGPKIVSVVIPCLNEEEAIGPLIAEIMAVNVDEVIVVDNGSRDRTAERAKAAGARVVTEPKPGYGRACAAGLASVRADCDIVCFLDGDGSDIPGFIPSVTGEIAEDRGDFVMGSRLRGKREPGSMTPQQLIAGRVAGLLLKAAYGVSFTDMSPFRAMRLERLRSLGMKENTYGWNLEMQMRVAAAGMRVVEIAVDHRRRRGGVSKVSGNVTAGLKAAAKIATTFWRLWRELPHKR
jgi:glycosyltransferase involved in cell wall biosynthesis